MAKFVNAETWPGAEHESDDDLISFARTTGSTVYHPVGSCAMGESESAPVDTSLRVKRLESLRVIDASVMPAMISGNTYATTIAIAEKGADLVLADARL